MRRPPDARCSGMFYGLRAEQKGGKRRRISFNVSFQPAKLPSWSSWQSLKKSRSCWFPQARCQRRDEQSAPLNPADSQWAADRHLQDTWYCIFHLQSLSPGTSPSLRISPALARRKTLSLLCNATPPHTATCLCKWNHEHFGNTTYSFTFKW